MNDQLNNKIAECKKDFLSIFDKEINLNDKEIKNELDKIKKEFEREFDKVNSNTIIIITTGMLKAGKSTLVNLLARSKFASPVGFGVDTTLRPVLIKMGKEGTNTDGKIHIYTDGEIDKIIDYYIGIHKEEPKNKKDIPLTKDNLKHTLCDEPGSIDQKFDKEPELVVVEVPYNQECKILQDDCLIFDMPGIDSANAECSKIPEKYNKFLQESALLLFVQSSITPINFSTVNYLQQIGSSRDRCTYRLIQNKMNAKYWEKEDIIKEDINKQASKAKTNFIEYLGNPSTTENTLSSNIVNLGMAYDKIFEQDKIDSQYLDSILTESGFVDFESNLLDDINKNRQEIKKQQFISSFNTKLEKKTGEIEENRESLDRTLEINNNSYNETNKKITKIDNICKTKISASSFEITQSIIDDFKNTIITKFQDNLKLPGYNDLLKVLKNESKEIKITDKIYNEYLNKCNESCYSLTEDFLKRLELQNILNNGMNSINLINSKIQEIPNKENVSPIDLLKTKNYKLFEKNEIIKLKLSKEKITEKKGVQEGIKKILSKFFHTKSKLNVNSEFFKNDWEEICKKYCNQIRTIINENTLEQINTILKNHLNSYYDGEKSDLNNKITEITDKNKKIQSDITSLNVLQKKLQEFSNFEKKYDL